MMERPAAGSWVAEGGDGVGVVVKSRGRYFFPLLRVLGIRR